MTAPGSKLAAPDPTDARLSFAAELDVATHVDGAAGAPPAAPAGGASAPVDGAALGNDCFARLAAAAADASPRLFTGESGARGRRLFTMRREPTT